MPRNLFTRDEIVLCTYAALYGARDLEGPESIEQLTHRSMDSIVMKIQNIEAMLDDFGVPRLTKTQGLSGLPRGQRGRRTNWEVVEPLTRVPRQELLNRCRAILAAASRRERS